MILTLDGLIAVSGLVRNFVVVTRNISDMEGSSVELLDTLGRVINLFSTKFIAKV